VADTRSHQTSPSIGLIAALMVLAAGGASCADDLTGQASIVDGDTLESHGTRVRLWGGDAPESSQLCRGEECLVHRCGCSRMAVPTVPTAIERGWIGTTADVRSDSVCVLKLF
jgi:hypothetical protein